jgi:DNA-binding PadR family transcriptional regulator
MAKRRRVSNLMALSLLSLLMERPMYPYEMASKLREYGKDQAIKINWGSLYTVVQNMEKHGLIEAVEVAREGRQPERTTYRITEAGVAELNDWLRELLSVPEREYTRFEAALGESMHLSPDELIGLLRQRLDALDAVNAELQAGLRTWGAKLPRLFFIETEYHLALRRAEADWVRGLLKELTDGTFPHLDAWRRYHKTGEVPAEFMQQEGEHLPNGPAWCGNTRTGPSTSSRSREDAKPEVPALQ